MSTIIEMPEFYNLNGDEYLIKNTTAQDVSSIIADNKAEAEASNGFSDGRTMRKVMSISQVDYLNALKLGYDLDATDPKELQREVYRYLRERGHEMGMQTVKHILTPGGNANIIVK